MKEIINMFKKQPDTQKLENEIKNTKFKTTIPVNYPTFEKWCLEYRVSMRHGKMANYIG